MSERLRLHFNNGERIWLAGDPGESIHEGRAFTWHPLLCANDAFDPPDRWLVSLYVVAPELLPAEAVRDVAEEYWGCLEDFRLQPQAEQGACLADYGYALAVKEWEGPRRGPLVLRARRKLAWVRDHLNYALEDRYNNVGSTGWDCLTGAPYPYERGYQRTAA